MAKYIVKRVAMGIFIGQEKMESSLDAAVVLLVDASYFTCLALR